MSAYSDWQCGAITEDQYRDSCNDEAARDEWYEYMRDREEENCYNCKCEMFSPRTIANPFEKGERDI